MTHRDRHSGDALHVHFAVDRSATATMISDASDGLGRALAAAGTRLDTVTVEVRSSGGASSPGVDPGNGNPGRGEDARRQPAARAFVPPPRSPSIKPVARDRFA